VAEDASNPRGAATDDDDKDLIFTLETPNAKAPRRIRRESSWHLPEFDDADKPTERGQNETTVA